MCHWSSDVSEMWSQDLWGSHYSSLLSRIVAGQEGWRYKNTYWYPFLWGQFSIFFLASTFHFCQHNMENCTQVMQQSTNILLIEFNNYFIGIWILTLLMCFQIAFHDAWRRSIKLNSWGASLGNISFHHGCHLRYIEYNNFAVSSGFLVSYIYWKLSMMVL